MLVIGNGESRTSIDINKPLHGPKVGCNALGETIIHRLSSMCRSTYGAMKQYTG